MFDLDLKPGDRVIIRATVVSDRAVLLDDGTEARLDRVAVLAELPKPLPAGQPWPLLLFFETEGDRARIAAAFAGVGCVDL